MKFKFKIQQYQTDAVDNTVAVFNGQPSHDTAMRYRRDLGKHGGIIFDDDDADYRNPLIASAMKTLGYVNMFNRGVGQVQADLKENGNPPAEFVVNLLTAFRVNVTDVEKVATTNEKVATSEQKVATPDDNIATGKKYKSSEEMAIYILEYCETWRSIDEITQFTDRDKNYIRNKVLPKLAEKLEKEYPDTPNHPKQRYRTKQKEGNA